jgi:phosphoadenosine phosphosulfate reductase
MPLKEITLFENKDKVAKAIEFIKENEPDEGYWLADSGGKDSEVVRDLTILSGVKYQGYHNKTTVDPPELIQHIKTNHPDTIILKPRLSMFSLIVKKRMPPTRIVRYCCEHLKEYSGYDRVLITGVRWQESYKRKQRKEVECGYGRQKRKFFINPILKWTSDDVWEYIRQREIEYCKLYDEGFKRLGCVLCPMSGHNGMLKDAKRWPKIKANYIRAFQKMVDKRIVDGLETKWATGQEVFDWWIQDTKKTKINKDQLTMFE